MNLQSRITRNRIALAAVLGAGLLFAVPAYVSAHPGDQAGDGTAAEARADRPQHPHGGKHHRDGRHHGGPFLKALKALDLSEAQQASIRTAIKAQWQSARSGHQALRQLQHAVETRTPDSAGYASQVNQLAEAQANAARDRVQQQAALKAEVYAMLTPAQKTALTEQLAKLPEPPARAERTGWRQR